MGQDQKAYEYDDVIEFTAGGSSMDNALQQIQTDLKALRELIERCEELYHGKGADSVVYKQYKGIYTNIGWVPSTGFWLTVKAAADLQNLMYSNAVDDKQRDQGAA